MTKRQTLIVKLRRRNTNQSWGISIAGGADLGSPIIVTRSENEDLQKGDVIKKIDEYDVRDIRHVDAQNLFKNSDSIRLIIERSELTSKASSRNHTPPPTIFKSNIGDRTPVISLPKSSQEPKVLPKSPIPPTPVEEFETRSFSPDHFNPPHEHLDEVREERVYLSQGRDSDLFKSVELPDANLSLK